MNRLPAITLVTVLLSLSGVAGTSADDAGERTVLVELFTSQGCSSCPPADRLLTELVADGSRGTKVIALSYHVDYWNYIGWTDPFSSADWSTRQRTYSRELAGGRTYTPQLVVDGIGECVGSNRREVNRLIAEAAARPTAAQLSAEATGNQLAVRATVPLGAGPAVVRVAVFETGLETEVGSGENARRTLHNDNVVRSLTTVAELASGQAWRGEHALAIDPTWRRDRLGVAIFLQSLDSLEILSATTTDLAPLTR